MHTTPYLEDINGRLWRYREARFPGNEQWVFDEPQRRGMRPPVFAKKYALRNVIVDRSLRTRSAIWCVHFCRRGSAIGGSGA